MFRRAIVLPGLCLIPAFTSLPAHGEEVAEPPDPFESVAQVTGYRGLQAWLAEQFRFDLELGYTMVWQLGGKTLDDAQSLVSGSYDIIGRWRAIDDSGIGSGSLGFLVEGGHNLTHRRDESLSDNVGSVFATNDDHDPTTDIAVTELWWEQALYDGDLLITVGKVDQTVTFDGNRVANDETAQFLATPLVNNPAIAFPDNGFGVDVVLTVSDWVALSAGWGNSVASATESTLNNLNFNNSFVVGQVAITPQTEALFGGLPGEYRFIVWHTDAMDSEGAGWAVSIDQQVLPNVVGFLRLGFGSEDVADFETFVSAGVGLEQPFGRPDDLLAIGFASGNTSHANGTADVHETLVEAFYRCQVTPTFAITPDVQFIANPGGRADDRSTWVAGLRGQFTF